MKRLLTAGLLCGLSAIGAAELTLLFDLESEVATTAGIAAFIGNFFMIEPMADISSRIAS